MKSQFFYPSAPVTWAQDIANLTSDEAAYGVRLGFLNFASKDEENVTGQPELAVIQDESASRKDLMFRILLVHLYKHWFLTPSPLQALEFLVLDFMDCPSAGIGRGRLLSGIAGISDPNPPSELDPEYFDRRVRTFQFLTEFVTIVVREGIRPR